VKGHGIESRQMTVYIEERPFVFSKIYLPISLALYLSIYLTIYLSHAFFFDCASDSCHKYFLNSSTRFYQAVAQVCLSSCSRTLNVYLYSILRSTKIHCFRLNIRNAPMQGCQMVCFQTKNTNLGKFRRALEWRWLECFLVIWNILRPFGIFYGQLVI
jgi:hypothetical protein